MTRRTLWRSWLVLVAAGCALVWIFTPKPTVEVPTAKAAAGMVSLPNIPAPLDKTEELALSAMDLPWGKEKQTQAGESPPLRWWAAGEFGQGKKRKLLLRFENDRQPAQLIGVGELLPDGRKLVSLERGSACVRADHQRKPICLVLLRELEGAIEASQ